MVIAGRAHCIYTLYIYIYIFSLTEQSIINHLYWVGNSSETPDEREERWRSILNHIANIHEHNGHKLFTKCLHETIVELGSKKVE